MDNGIYHPASVDLGIYLARRLPKGGAAAALAPSGAGVAVDKPNYATIDMTSNLGDVAPGGGLRERKRYTVPKNRRATVQNGNVTMLRKTAGAPNSFSWGAIFVTRAGRTDADKEILAMIDNIFAAAGNSDHATISPGNAVDLFEGDQVWIADADNSTGGTIDIIISAVIIEFDASYTYNVNPNSTRFDPAGSSAAAPLPLGSGFGMASQLFAPSLGAPSAPVSPPFAYWPGK